MARTYKKRYSAYQRHILAEFMTAKELAALDRKYNDAKLQREIRRAKAAAGKV